MTSSLKTIAELAELEHTSPDGDHIMYDLDDVWKVLGYSAKSGAVRAVRKLPKEHWVTHKAPRPTGRGGYNKIKYLVDKAGLYLMLAKTNSVMADRFREYLLAAEEVYQNNKDAIDPDETSWARETYSEWKASTAADSKTPEGEEEAVRSRLHAAVGGEKEVDLGRLGRADIVTATEIIEVKSVCKWKHALGQVLVYGTAFEQLRERVHLFGTCDDATKAVIKEAMDTYGVRCTFEP